MNENLNENTTVPASEEEQYSLNDDRRVKVLSPGAMVAKRFFRNRIAVVGLVILAFMFLFSFLGGVITPYKEDQKFYRVEYQNKEYAGAATPAAAHSPAATGTFPDSRIPISSSPVSRILISSRIPASRTPVSRIPATGTWVTGIPATGISPDSRQL